MTGCDQIVRFLLCGLASLALSAPLRAAEGALVQRYDQLFRQAQAVFRQEPTNAAAAWQFARACFDSADLATNHAQRADLAQLGMAAAREALRLSPNLAAAHYYLALNLGQLAQTKSLGALKLVGDLEREFKRARELDARFDFAGADRGLGLLYRDAPGWPISVGSKSKARQHLEKARQLSPEYPDNQLNLLEAWLKWGESKKVLAALKPIDAALTEAKKKLVGQQWAYAWADWDRRWHDLQAKAAETPRPPAPPKFAK
jgi:hypothetical protein